MCTVNMCNGDMKSTQNCTKYRCDHCRLNFCNRLNVQRNVMRSQCATLLSTRVIYKLLFSLSSRNLSYPTAHWHTDRCIEPSADHLDGSTQCLASAEGELSPSCLCVTWFTREMFSIRAPSRLILSASRKQETSLRQFFHEFHSLSGLCVREWERRKNLEKGFAHNQLNQVDSVRVRSEHSRPRENRCAYEWQGTRKEKRYVYINTHKHLGHFFLLSLPLSQWLRDAASHMTDNLLSR